MTIDWSAMWKPEWEQERDELMRQHTAAQQATASAQATDPPPTPTPIAKTQGVPPAAAGSAPTRLDTPMNAAAPKRAPDPVEILSAALDAAPSDAQRAELLAAAPLEIREQFRAQLMYQQLVRSVEANPYADFERALAAASDDSARRELIARCEAAFLAEWAWRVKASVEDWQRRYLELIA